MNHEQYCSDDGRCYVQPFHGLWWHRTRTDNIRTIRYVGLHGAILLKNDASRLLTIQSVWCRCADHGAPFVQYFDRWHRGVMSQR